jgi:hypothetical protein
VRRHLLAALAAFMMLAAGAGVAVAKAPPRLSALGPTVFQIGGRTIRQVRYRDTATLVYSFTLRNDGQLPLSVTGLAPLENQPQLFHYLGITDAQGHKRFTVGAGKDTPVRLSMRMQSCETLSARRQLRDGGQPSDVARRRARRRGARPLARRGTHWLPA